MTQARYRTLLGATLAALFVGAAVAQTPSDDPSRLPANKAAPQAEQTQPAAAPTDKMKDQSEAQPAAADQAAGKAAATKHAATKKAPADKEASAAKSTKHARQASKAHNQTTAALDPNEKAFRQALRQCAKEQQQTERDSCLDTAIEQFQRG